MVSRSPLPHTTALLPRSSPTPRGIPVMYDDLKMDLCRGARVLFRYGLSVGIAGHLSIKVDGGRMIANRFGPSFGTLAPSDVLLLDLDGNILDGKGIVNDTIRLHGVIHQINPDV